MKHEIEAKGWSVLCPFCGSEDPQLAIDLNDFEKITCNDCGTDFSAKDAYDAACEQCAKWQRIVMWVEAAKVGVAEMKDEGAR